MAYNLKIIENDKTKEQTIKDLKEFKEILEQFRDKNIEVELHKIKVLKKGE